MRERSDRWDDTIDPHIEGAIFSPDFLVAKLWQLSLFNSPPVQCPVLLICLVSSMLSKWSIWNLIKRESFAGPMLLFVCQMS
mmetsp:Transcript_46897/g.142071  ORF Transcript_46897/g.142071 Transcript_46897/m.142071 type:complete len:82 (-) Transcript_46897:661-906(-)